MFNAHDPRAQAILSVHHGHISVVGTDFGGDPEFHAEDDTLPGWITDLHANGYITFDAGILPAQVRVTDLGSLVLTAAFSIIPPAPVRPKREEVSDMSVDIDGPDTDDGKPIAFDELPSSGEVTVEYYGLSPAALDFIDSKFLALVAEHGYTLQVDDRGQVAPGEPLSGKEYLSVVDPLTGARMYVLYDDETWSNLESPGFTELLKLMDEYSTAETGTRLFMFEPEADEEEDDLNLIVDEDHPCYGLGYDFTQGRYSR
jgi:hypothetical protein